MGKAIDNISLDYGQGQRPEKRPLRRCYGSQLLRNDGRGRACLTKRFGFSASGSHSKVAVSCEGEMLTLKKGLKLNKHKASSNDEWQTVLNICKTIYLICYIRPIFNSLLLPLDLYRFQWTEATLRCKKERENKVLVNEGASTTPTKIDTIIVNKHFDLEVTILEILGPNNKVDTTHFLEDKKKTAKNLRYMYDTIVSTKDRPPIKTERALKVYGFHVYLNTLHVYSLKQPTLGGPYIFQEELSIKLIHTKVVIPSLSALVLQLWLIRPLLEAQHQQLLDFVYEDLTPASSNSGSDKEGHYAPPCKKQKV